MTTKQLDLFFQPRGIAIIGASRNPTKLGFGLARNLVSSGYSGSIYFVNPGGGSLLERPIYHNLQEVPDPVDLAVILIPADLVPGIVLECGERGIQAVIVASGGFREIGAEGAALEDRVPAVRPRIWNKVVRPKLHRHPGHPSPYGYDFFTPTRTYTRRCGVYLPFRGDLRSSDRLGQGPGVWAFPIGQPW